MIKPSKNLPPWGNLALEPTPAQSAAWDALTREEQLAVFREAVDGPDARSDSGMTADEVFARARADSRQEPCLSIAFRGTPEGNWTASMSLPNFVLGQTGRHLCFGFDSDISKARRLDEIREGA